jgi:LmbE family N-acetylglucosaminyl deacetylase
MFYLYLSPHLDDAVLSCGGQIAQLVRSGQVLVATVFAGDVPAKCVARTAFVQELHTRWGLGDNPPAARRAEDLAALKSLGSQAMHLPFLDCVYRLGRMGAPLYPTREAIFGPAAEVEAELIEEIVRALGRLNLPHDAKVFLPLTAGHHVDHQIVRVAGERWAGSRPVAFYEDYPYAEKSDEVTAALGRKTLRAEIVPLDEAALAAKIAAIACYRSQLSTFFANEPEIAIRVRTYAEAVGAGQPAERLWRPGPGLGETWA